MHNNTEMFIMLDVTCLPCLDETYRTSEEVETFGRNELVVMVMVGDINISWFQSIYRYPILSIAELYTEALVCSGEYKERPSVRAGKRRLVKL